MDQRRSQVKIFATVFASRALWQRWSVVLGLLVLGVEGRSLAAQAKADLPTLVVYTYQSFVSQWGPGEAIRKTFEETCHCQLRWVASSDAAALMGRLLLEGRHSKADVVLGLDAQFLAEIKAHHLLQAYQPRDFARLELPVAWDEQNLLVPYAYGYLAVMYDSRKIQAYPSWKRLIEDPQGGKQLLLEDPRTSSLGLGLVSWFKQSYPQEYAALVRKLTRRVVTLTKGWSEAYGLFLKGEAPMVLSYTLSEAYQRQLDPKTPYRAMIFQEGHPLQVEGMGITRGSKQLDLAKKFIDHLFSLGSQELIAAQHWMYPVRRQGVKLPEVFAHVGQPSHSFLSYSLPEGEQRKAWVREWTDLWMHL